MCGIFGWQYNLDNLPPPEWRAVVGLILADETESRGRDASGYAHFDDSDQSVYFRKESKKYTESALMMETLRFTNVIAHTRYATVGAKTDPNAHPWHIGHIVGAHNGGIWNHKELRDLYEDRASYEVDSMHLIRHIADELDTTELEGYGTVEWFDVRDKGAVYLCAMKRGDLEIEVLPDEQGVVWASTRHALCKALRMVGVYAKSKQFSVEQSVVYRIFDGKIEATDRRIELGDTVAAYTSAPWKSAPWNGWQSETRNGITVYTQAKEPVTTLPALTEPDLDSDYRKAVSEYNRECGRLFGDRSTMTRRQHKRFEKLLVLTEQHTDACNCSFCLEIFRLAAAGT